MRSSKERWDGRRWPAAVVSLRRAPVRHIPLRDDLAALSILLEEGNLDLVVWAQGPEDLIRSG